MFGQLGYLISESFRGLRQHRMVILPSMVTIFLCSLLLASSVAVFGGVLKILNLEKNLYTIEAFLPEAVSSDSLKVIENRLKHFKHIDSVSFISADSALADFRNHFSKEMLDLVDENPLPPFFRLTLNENSKNPLDIIEAKNALLRENFFEEVEAPIEWIEKISALKFKMIFWPICISILLLITLSLIICNSMRLSLLSRKLLVENMKYAGGSHFFIQFPFVLQGVILGFLGSIFAVALLMTVLKTFALNFPIIESTVVGLKLPLIFVVVVVTFMSGYFSFRTVRSFLLTKRNEQE